LKLKNIKIIATVALLIAAILSLAIFGFSCVSGMMAIGWSGGVVSNNTLYVGSIEGRLAAVNLADQSRQWAEPLKVPAQGGLLGCSSALSCGGGTTRVPIYGTPVVSDNIVYIAGYNGKIYAYNTTNLASRWVFPRDGYLHPLVGGLVIDQDKLFIGCSDGYVYCLDATTGDLLAEFQTNDKIWGTPTVADNILYIGSFDKTLYALDTANLTLKWQYTTEGSIIATPLVSNGTVYIGSCDRYFYALDAASGAFKWKFMAYNWFWAQPVIVNNTVYVGCLDGNVYALQADSGDIVKTYDISELFNVSRSGLASQPVAVENYIFFATQSGTIYKVDTATQEMKSVQPLTGTIDGPLMAHDGIIYFQTQDAAIQRINASNGVLLSPISLVSS
jgi:eukaryotic-like serine/threonine-protein kinase